MTMVGLFWIAEGDVYLGAKPSGLAPGVRLSPDGVVALGDGQYALHPWEDVRALTVTDAPVKTLRHQVGVVGNLALGAVTGWVNEPAPMMTVRMESSSGEHELAAFVAAAAGYSPTELDLSHTLLSRLTEGAATMATTLACMSEWGRAWEGGSPRAAERERLLREWVG
ncbi:hypothetical protein ACFYOV_25820 [Streptomyces sp. NPDC005931]|uniref:hypothetical protein n=1 Tax=Streptomyces sp. NPDC005931 TaxID=3364737 RepID=UPI0036C2F69F